MGKMEQQLASPQSHPSRPGPGSGSYFPVMLVLSSFGTMLEIELLFVVFLPIVCMLPARKAKEERQPESTAGSVSGTRP
jgi:hypothetical protein